ncbi:MBL fold metallo-hydrolase [Candidatus Fermentibacteria bacterium]|nr:MBL fold metallo-hydrolase [Candidatus Fermentibacteria bacterium]
MKATIVYDNTSLENNLQADWGFACLVEAHGRKILFDTGANGSILMGNMAGLGIDPMEVQEVLISHDHWDHTGGLSDFLRVNSVPVYVPGSCREPFGTSEVIKVEDSREIHEGIFSTGELKGIEQSLVLATEKGPVVVAGCSHPGVGTILTAASQWGNVHALIGGLHGFDELGLLEDLKLVCPTHCTQHISDIKKSYPGKYVQGGAGKVIEV